MGYYSWEIEKKLKKTSPKDIYNLNAVNYKGRTPKRTKQNLLYTEIIGKYVLENKPLDHIKRINRTKPYKVASHYSSSGSIITDRKDTNRLEENEVKELIEFGIKNSNFNDGLGSLKDYQIPVKETNDNKKVGKIDLISINDETKTLYIIEVKNSVSKESLLRCILEISTYYKQIVFDKLCDEYNIKGYRVKRAILIFKNTRPYFEYKDKIKHHYTNELLDDDIDVYIISKTNEYRLERE